MTYSYRIIMLVPLLLFFSIFFTYASAQDSPPAAPSVLAQAKVCFRQGDYAKVETLLASPSGADAWALRFASLLQTGKHADVQALLKTVPPKLQISPTILIVRGRLHMQRGDYAAAETDLKTAMGDIGGTQSDAQLLARLRLAELYDRLGYREKVYQVTDWFFDYYSSVENEKMSGAAAFCVGAGAVLAGDFQNGIRVVALAQKKDPVWPEPFVRVGEIFGQKYQYTDAKNEYESALKLNPHHPAALSGMAFLFSLQRNMAAAEDYARHALSVNAGETQAWQVLAYLQVVDEEYDDALSLCEKGLTSHPSDPELLSLKAAIAHIHGKTKQYENARTALLALPEALSSATAEEKVAAKNVLDARLHVLVSNLLSVNYRLLDATAFAKKAMELDPENDSAHTEYGMCLMRWGRETEARPVLETAFQLDPYNVRVSNMLKLIRRKTLYKVVKTDRFTIQLFEKDEPVFRHYMPEADAMLTACEKRFGAKVNDAVRMSILKSHSDFSARVSGLPQLDATGATFGPFVALVSPADWFRRGRTFSWRSVMLHELAHVVTVTASKYRIPRWLTEGMSVHTEGWSTPEWDAPFASMMASGNLPSLLTWNRSFHRPKVGWMVPASYMAAGLFVRWFEEEYGAEALQKTLPLYASGKRTSEVFSSITGKSVGELDLWFQKKLTAYATNVQAPILGDPSRIEEYEAALNASPEDAAVKLELFRSYRMMRHPKALSLAEEELKPLLAKDSTEVKSTPLQVESALLLAQISFQKNDTTRAESLLAVVERAAQKRAQYQLLKGILAEAQKKPDVAKRCYEEAIRLYPRFSQDLPLGNPYQRLAAILENEKSIDALTELLERYVNIRHDEAHALRKLAVVYKDQEKIKEAASAYARLMGVDPYWKKDHLEYASVLKALGLSAQAKKESDIASVAREAPMEPDNAGDSGTTVLPAKK